MRPGCIVRISSFVCIAYIVNSRRYAAVHRTYRCVKAHRRQSNVMSYDFACPRKQCNYKSVTNTTVYFLGVFA